jgi:hypothetical protein
MFGSLLAGKIGYAASCVLAATASTPAARRSAT